MRVLIVDDHALIREGLATILRPEPDFQVVGLVGTVAEAVEQAVLLKPNLILMDVSLPDGSGIDAALAIRSRQPDCKIVFLTVSEADDNLFAAIRSGAKGYLLKNVAPAKLVAALRAVERGQSALSRSMTLRLMDEFARSLAPAPAEVAASGLSRRELEVLQALSIGRTNQEIADLLYISENTVKAHVHSILEKLGLADRHAAARYAQERGLLK
jgi:DNA-binding NarL/FixJ family response regulator